MRVVELAGLGPAPFCAMLLADLGADVVRVGRPGGGGGHAQDDVVNRGKRAVEVDLKDPAGIAALLRAVETADVLVEGFRPGVAERLGIGPDECARVNPRLVYGRMTGWGQDGPLAHTAGHDIDYVALTGMLHAIGRKDGPPQVPLNLVGDFGGGSLYLAVGLLAAVFEARSSGRGQVVDASIVDGSAHLGTMIYGMLASGGWKPERGSNLLDTGAPFYDVYETSDGGHMAVGALEPQFYAELLRVLDIEDEVPDRADPSTWPVLRDVLGKRFAERTRDEWTRLFEGTEACVAPVLSLAEAPDHPHMAERGTFVDHDGTVQPAPAPRFSRTAVPAPGPVPNAVQDLDAVAVEWGTENGKDT
ncbi:CoA transferase [Allosaccharopolyspora coralli]|uniref:CoA transferase n=1 Tax=Allosaccharopolyspora coralli TaxID=2665642 RepID=A0A5Q3QDD8_9PSEU|nr:CoA transferase [Allosaccharopolyspora coralli]